MLCGYKTGRLLRLGLLASELAVEVQQNDRENKRYSAEENVDGLHLEAGGIEVRCSALLLTEAVLLHALHLV